MRKPIIPMEPKRSDTIPKGQDWISQIKWDGVRVLTYYDGDEIRLFNRKGNERTLHYPEITNIHAYCTADSVILDGEVIALGADGKPSFHEVMRRDGLRRMEKVPQAAQLVPITYMVFDILFKNGQWINQLPLSQRLEILQTTISTNEQIQLVSSHPDGESLFAVVKQYGMEGIVMKKPHSPYLIGEKKDTWLKIKNYQDLIAVVGGYTLNSGIVNAVLLGLYDENGKLWYVGHTGTGKMTRQEWVNLTKALQPSTVKERPFVNRPERIAGAFWVKPTVAMKIQFMEWTPDHSLRQPSIQSIVDVPVTECRF